MSLDDSFTLVSPGEGFKREADSDKVENGEIVERKNVFMTIPSKSVLIIFPLVGNKRST